MMKKISILALLSILLVSSGFGCKPNNSVTNKAMEPVTLRYWRVLDGPDAFEEIIAKYSAIHPYIKVEYRKLRLDEYENELLNALAEDRGPDIFSIHNTWIRKYQTKIEALPPSTTMVYPVEKGSIKKEIVNELRTAPSLSVGQVKDLFVDVVGKDVILEDGKIYGLPLSVDTLAMFYNKDLLNNAGISEAPKYWDGEFLQTVKKLSKQDPKRGLIQSGLAMGGSENIERYTDILSLLMMQNGAVMINDANKVSFHLVPEVSRNTAYNPGLEALRFYTDFANPGKESYSWNNELNNSLEMFSSGNLALMFGYSYHAPIIRAAAPKLNFSVANFPQIQGSNSQVSINFANYWVETVSKKSQHINEAWNFLQFISDAEQVKIYLEKSQKPTALRSLVSGQRSDDNIGVFADQVLTARSWYRGSNVKAAEQAFAQMIDAALANNEIDLLKIITSGATRIQQTIY